MEDQLQELRPLDLPPGKTDVDLPLKEIHKIEMFGILLQEFTIPLGADLNKPSQLHPPDGRRTLKGYTNTHLCPFIDREIGDIFSVKDDLPLDCVTCKSHDGVQEGSLARTVRPKNGVDFTLVYL